MPTTGKIQGRIVNLFINDDPDGVGTPVQVGCSTSCEWSREMSLSEAVCKGDNPKYFDGIPDQHSGSCTLEGLIIYSETINVAELYGYMDAETELEITINSGVTGDDNKTVRGYITSLSDSYPVSGVATYSMTFTHIGAPTYAALP